VRCRLPSRSRVSPPQRSAGHVRCRLRLCRMGARPGARRVGSDDRHRERFATRDLRCNPGNMSHGTQIALPIWAAPTSWTADRQELVGRNATIDNRRRGVRAFPWRSGVGAGLDQCAPCRRPSSSTAGAGRDRLSSARPTMPLRRRVIERYRLHDLTGPSRGRRYWDDCSARCRRRRRIGRWTSC